MQRIAYRTIAVLSRLLERFPIGTNLGLVHLLWMMLSGRLLVSRGAVIPGLAAAGLSEPAVRRAWAALGTGAWQTSLLVARWQALVEAEGRWQPNVHAGLKPVAVDITHLLRPRLVDCPTKCYPTKTGHSVPAIPLGLIVRVGKVGSQRLGMPVAMVRAPLAEGAAAKGSAAKGSAAKGSAEKTEPIREAHTRAVVRAAVARLAEDEVGVFDRGFLISLLQAEGCVRYVVRLFTNFTCRRTTPAPYKGRGRPPTRGEIVRPLGRTRKGRFYPPTPPDREETWVEDGVTLRAELWLDLVLPEALPTSPTFDVVAIYDPRYQEPLLLATSLPSQRMAAKTAHALYLDRWPVEQVFSAKQMVGSQRQFVHAPETCQRLPELSLLAGSILSYLAACEPAIPTGFWDRRPQPTPGRLRRALGACDFPKDLVPTERIRQKASLHAHLPKGHFGQPRRHHARPPAKTPQVTEN